MIFETSDTSMILLPLFPDAYFCATIQPVTNLTNNEPRQMGESLQHMMPWVDWLHDHQYLGIISQGRYDHFFFPKQKKRKTSRNIQKYKIMKHMSFFLLPVWTLNLYILGIESLPRTLC